MREPSAYRRTDQSKKEGYEAILFFVIRMKEVRYFTPNQKTQPEFAEALKKSKGGRCEDLGVRL